MSRQAALRAQTDRTLAAIRDGRRKGGRRVDRLAPSAAEVAEAIREEFGPDAAVAGRVLVAVSPQLHLLAGQLQAAGGNMAAVPGVLADLLGLAGEELCREQKAAS